MEKLPVAIFLFKRSETLEKIFSRIREYQPTRLYFIADGPRDEEERKLVLNTRLLAESLVDWDCDIVKNYSDSNRGVFENIGNGARWVFEREEKAIFLEDDNLPESSFFYFCEKMLERYASNRNVFWVCGTNYLDDFKCENDYVFTKHMLPCGWASWSSKFNKYYDGKMENFKENASGFLKEKYDSRRLYHQDYANFIKTKRLLDKGDSRASWDRQVAFTLRYFDLLGIAPVKNQIKNIGVDGHSTHGGTNLNITMTKRFCEIDTHIIEFPLAHPSIISINREFEFRTEKVILLPLKSRLLMKAAYFIKPMIGVRRDESLKQWLKEKFNNNGNKK